MTSKTHPFRIWDEAAELRSARRKANREELANHYHVTARRGVEEHNARVALAKEFDLPIDLLTN